ncbi:hypothetical protein OG242_01710 [Streptomyces sp. NBC_00727]|uniref:hypothetical protein n=1 Tax=Streptomyces sp. NBC_00727 TaxID=2903675 RepID=UPI0038682BD3
MRGARARRAAGAVQGLGAGAVLLAYWTTVALLAWWTGGPRTSGGESVRRKA